MNQVRKIILVAIDTLRDMEVNPYPYSFERTNFTNEIVENFNKFEDKQISVAGRIMSIRLMGKASFFHIQDQNGKIQVYIRKDQVGDNTFEVFKILDIGDIVGIKGKVFKTRTEEVSVLAEGTAPWTNSWACLRCSRTILWDMDSA